MAPLDQFSLEDFGGVVAMNIRGVFAASDLRLGLGYPLPGRSARGEAA
jgi:hypothetical protein